MRTLDLNLASRPFRNNTVLWVVYGVATALLVFFTYWNIDRYTTYREYVVDLTIQRGADVNEIQQLENRDQQAIREIDAVDLKSLRIQARKANDVIQWKSFSWTRLFNQLEAVQPWGIKMTSVHPAFRTDRGRRQDDSRPEGMVPVSVEGYARDFPSFFEFERALLLDPHFARVEPEKTKKSEHSGEVVFNIRFLYDPKLPQEEPGEDAELIALAGDGADADEPQALEESADEAATAAPTETEELPAVEPEAIPEVEQATPEAPGAAEVATPAVVGKPQAPTRTDQAERPPRRGATRARDRGRDVNRGRDATGQRAPVKPTTRSNRPRPADPSGPSEEEE